MMSNDEMDPAEITPHLSLVCNCKIINFFFFTNASANAYQRTTWPIQIHCWIQGQLLSDHDFSKTTNSKLPQFYLQREKTP